MKFIRFLLFCLAGLVVLAAVALALAFNSSVQTWLTGRALASQPGLDLKVGKVDAGLHVTKVENLRFAQPGLVLTLPSVEIDVSVIDAAHSRVNVKRLIAKGWTLDLSSPAPTKSAPPPPPSAASVASAPSSTPQPPAAITATTFQGILQQLHLPVDCALDELDLEGTVILPDGRGEAHLVVTGGGLGAGKEGTITCKANAVSPGKDAAVSSLVVQSDFAIHMDTPRTFDRVTITTGATVTGSQFPQGSHIQVVLKAAKIDAGAESYSAIFQAGQKQLVNLSIALPAGDAPLHGTWSLKMDDTDLAPFVLGRPLPAFTAEGQGTFTTDRSFSQLHANGDLSATVDQLSRLSPKFSDIAAATFTTNFDVTRQGDILRIDQFNSQLSAANPVVSMETRQVLRFNLSTHAIEAVNPANDLFDISLQGVPLAWLRPFLPDLTVTGDDLRGEFAATASNGGFSIRPLAPLALGNLSISQTSKPLVRGLTVSLNTSADYTPQGWHAGLSGQISSSAPAPLLTFDASANQAAGVNQPLKADGTFEADLPAVLAQPCASSASISLAKGTARGKFSASLTDKQTASLTLQLANFTTTAGAVMPGVDVYVSADRDASGLLNVQAPIVITQAGRKSDLTLAAAIQSVKTGTAIDAQVTSTALYIEDLQRFAALTATPTPAPAVAAKAPTSAATSVPAKSPVAPAAPAAAPAASPATVALAGPPWAGFTGSLKLTLKKIVASSLLIVTDVTGTVKITPDAVSIDALQASLGDGSLLKTTGVLSYDAKQAKSPYGLTADVALTGFNPAPMLLILNPDTPAQVDGKFDVTSHLSGRAADFSQFADTTLGSVNVASSGGTLRVLSVKASATANKVSTVSAVVGLFGALTGNSIASQYAGRGQAAADAMQQLNVIDYTQLGVVISRDQQRDVVVKSINLVSPQIHLTGSGQVTYTDGVPFSRWPLEIDLQLGARAQLATDLQTLRLIGSDGADTLGYLPLAEPITLTGTLQSISAKQLQDLINRAISN